MKRDKTINEVSALQLEYRFFSLEYSKYRFTLTPRRLALGTTLFLCIFANGTFFLKLNETMPISSENALFYSSVVLVFYALALLIIELLSVIIPVRIVSTMLIFSSAISGYFMDNFGVVIDTDMLLNALQTNTGEAGDLFTLALFVHLVLFGMLPVVFIFLVPYQHQDRPARLRNHIQILVVSILIILVNIGIFNSQYASFFREHRSVRYYTNPFYPLHSVVKILPSLIKTTPSGKLKVLDADPKITEIEEDQPELIIMVVGETARADHFSLNGYARNTNPELSKLPGVISFANLTSCGTSTAVSVPCMFSFSDEKSFDGDTATQTQNVLDVLSKAGVSVLWRDNNSSSKGVAERISYQNFKAPDMNPVCDIECRDEGMLSGLQDYVDAQSGDIMIVLHQMGSHGPAYYKRYPAEFSVYEPACQSNILSDCPREDIINAYDNTILYTDYFLSKVISFLNMNSKNYETAMIYMSDHGESLGEYGVYLHGLPKVIAPASQVHVPVVIWASESADIDLAQTKVFAGEPSSHDALAISLLALFEVDSTLIKDNQNKPLIILKDESEEPRVLHH